MSKQASGVVLLCAYIVAATVLTWYIVKEDERTNNEIVDAIEAVGEVCEAK